MADSKITALTALTAADPVNDMFPVVDVSDTTMAASGTTKRISVNNILGASGVATLASATITGAATVGTTLGVTGASTLASVGVTGAATVGTTLLVGTNATLTNGNVIIGTSGKGIDFSATANSSGTMTSELLADYEEGTFTPTITASSGTLTTTTVNAAAYTKIGRLVSVSIDISIVNIGTASGQLFFSLPFSQGTDINVGVLRELGATGNNGQITYQSATTAYACFFGNGSLIVNGYRIRGTYTYSV
jgi:hypothetical protein